MYFLDDGYLHGYVGKTLAAFDLKKQKWKKLGQIVLCYELIVFGNSLAVSKVDHPHLQTLRGPYYFRLSLWHNPFYASLIKNFVTKFRN
jgi:hypothetical protein